MCYPGVFTCVYGGGPKVQDNQGECWAILPRAIICGSVTVCVCVCVKTMWAQGACRLWSLRKVTSRFLCGQSDWVCLCLPAQPLPDWIYQKAANGAGYQARTGENSLSFSSKGLWLKCQGHTPLNHQREGCFLRSGAVSLFHGDRNPAAGRCWVWAFSR